MNLKKYKVPKSAITEKGLKRLIRDAVREEGVTYSEWAKDNGLTPQSVSAFLSETQSAGLKIPEVFGYRPQVIYLPVDEDPIQHANPSRVVKVKGKRG